MLWLLVAVFSAYARAPPAFVVGLMNASPGSGVVGCCGCGAGGGRVSRGTVRAPRLCHGGAGCVGGRGLSLGRAGPAS